MSLVLSIRGRDLRLIAFVRRQGKQLRIDVVFRFLLHLLPSWRSVADSAVGKEARCVCFRARRGLVFCTRRRTGIQYIAHVCVRPALCVGRMIGLARRTTISRRQRTRLSFRFLLRGHSVLAIFQRGIQCLEDPPRPPTWCGFEPMVDRGLIVPLRRAL
jgi:hypothetical protein